MTSPLDAVLLLARSENRIRALEVLIEGPCSRNDLAETVGVSRVTASRILEELVAHGWATVVDRMYRATELGEIVFEAFEAVLETVGATQQLTAIAPWLDAEFDVDRRRLLDAEIVLPTSGDPLAPVRHAAILMREAETVRGLGTGIAPEALRANRDAVVDDGQSFEVVFSEEVLQLITADPRMAQWLSEMLAAGAVVYSHYAIKHLTGEFDGETVFLGVADDSGMPRGGIESRDDAVLEWFERTFERYREEAEIVGVDFEIE